MTQSGFRARETDVFQTSVNVRGGQTVEFDLTYQEILNRVHGLYKHTVNVINSNVRHEIWSSES